MKILLFLFLFISLNASEKRDVIIDGFVSQDGKNFYHPKKFNFEKDKFKKAYIKLNINKKILEKKAFYLKITCDVNSLVYTNSSYGTNYDKLIIKLDKNSPSELIFNFEYEKEQNLNFKVLKYNDFEFEYITKNEGVLYGIAYGIMFSAFLYNLVIFLYTFQRSFIYYAFMQLTLLTILAYITVLAKQTYITDFEQITIDFLETFCVLLTILFSKEILNTKRKMRTIDKVLNFLVYINVVDLISIFIFSKSLLYEYLPRSLVISLLVLSGIIALFRGQKTAIFYFLGWFVLFVSLLMAEHDLIDLDEIYILHIGFPLESLILSFALGYKLKQTVDEKKQKEKILVHQSKLASMGEMINNIAHQWRQPLTHLSFINMDLQMASQCNDLSSKYLCEKLNESNNQLDFMSNTIDNFKDFYKPSKKKEYFYVSDALNKAVDIVSPSIKSSGIKLDIKIESDKRIFAYENEYSQVVLNFLSNAKDILVNRNIKNPKIDVLLEVIGGKCFLRVYDNAGGIEEAIFDKIFEPYFTTKDKSSGIGLYMSKIIVESHFNGEINVINTDLGACFVIEI